MLGFFIFMGIVFLLSYMSVSAGRPANRDSIESDIKDMKNYADVEHMDRIRKGFRYDD